MGVEVEGDVIEVEGAEGEGQGEGSGLPGAGEGQGSGDGGAAAAEGAGAAGEGGEGDSGEIVITFGDETPPPEDDDQARAPTWVRELRKSNRELVRRQRELEAENQRLKGTAGGGQPAAVVVGEKPTLASCGFDEDKYETELEAWHGRKAKAAEQERQAQQAEQKARDAWQAKLDGYGKAKGALKVQDFDDAEAAAQDVLNVVQQGVILQGAENPALMIYALGKNPKKAQELASITDPVRFAFAVAKLETQLKTSPRKQAPAPERAVRGNIAGATAALDNQLERLREEAARTGDLSKVMAYRRQQRSARA